MWVARGSFIKMTFCIISDMFKVMLDDWCPVKSDTSTRTNRDFQTMKKKSVTTVAVSFTHCSLHVYTQHAIFCGMYTYCKYHLMFRWWRLTSQQLSERFGAGWRDGKGQLVHGNTISYCQGIYLPVRNFSGQQLPEENTETVIGDNKRHIYHKIQGLCIQSYIRTELFP